MAKSRPESMIIPPEVFDETNTTNTSKKRSTPIQGRSSSSSNDSTNVKNINSDNTNSSSQNLIRTTTSSTTTDSDFESEQDDNSQSRKNDSNSQEQLSRRVKHFHKLFKSEIPGDMPDVIDSYVCAYQGDILLQGKMYITNQYLCFHSRIISYVTKHVYRWEQIEFITKERVAFIFPTAIGIQLKHTDKRIIYASFLTRDQAHDKIVSIWSRHVHDISSHDDEESDLNHDGTLKATHNNDKKQQYKRESYDIIDGPEQDEVLQMYLKENNKRPCSLLVSKHSNEKQQSKILINSYHKKSSEKNSNLNSKLSNGSNENISNTKQSNRNSRFTKAEKKQNDIAKRNSSLVNHRSKKHSSKTRESRSQDRTSSPVNETISQSNSSPTLIPNITPSITDTKSNSIVPKLLNIIAPFINLIIQSILSVVRHFQTYPVRTLTIMLLFLTVLFLHAFYLMKLANRIENRLQSLHHLWPSSAIRNSFSSNTKEL